MEDKKENNKERDFEKYSWAPVMQRINGSEELSQYLRGALVGNAVKQGSNGKGLEGLVEGVMSTDESKQNAINYTAEQYEAEIKGIKIGEYLSHYNEILKNYFGDKIPSMETYKDMTLDDLSKKIVELTHDSKHPTDKEKKKKAKEELEKYSIIRSVLKIIQDDYFKEHLPEAIERTNKDLAQRVLIEEKKKSKSD